MDSPRGRRSGPVAAVLLLAASVAACASSAPPSDPPRPLASSFEDYAVAFCAAWDSLFRAVGNPDSGAGSELSDALDDAVAARDELAAERLAAQIDAELQAGRESAAVAAGWAPAAPMMAAMDRVFVAFAAMTDAKVAVSEDAPGAVDPQIALEQAGGMDAWTSMLLAAQGMQRPPGAGSEPCANVPVTP